MTDLFFLLLETLCFCKGEKFNISLFQTIWRACIHAATLNPSPLWLSIPGHLYYSYNSIPTQNWIIITVSTPLTFAIKFKKSMTIGSWSLSLILSVHITNGLIVIVDKKHQDFRGHVSCLYFGLRFWFKKHKFDQSCQNSNHLQNPIFYIASVFPISGRFPGWKVILLVTNE